MTEHTPGPWSVEDIGREVFIVREPHDHIAHLQPGFEHNARLIAAAPDLLEIVKDLVLLDKDWGTGQWFDDVADLANRARKALDNEYSTS